MKCEYCNGTGEIINDAMRWTSCPVCGGKGDIEQTNEEWFDTLTTKGKAETIAQLSSYGGNVEAILDWLKGKHNEIC